MAIFQDNRRLILRFKWLGVFFLACLALLFARIWYLSVLQYDHYQELARRNHIRTVPLRAPRGIIYDRDGRVLADSVSAFNALLFREEAENLDKTRQFLLNGLKLDGSTLDERLERAASYSLFQPLTIKENLSLEEMAYLLSRQVEFPEIRISEQPRRRYTYGELASHVLGYVGEISRRQLEQKEYSRYRPGDIVGKYGVERTYNQKLTGINGIRRVLVNSLGKSIEAVHTVEPIQGEDVHLTLDLDLQWVAETELGTEPGAVVALDPRNGDILALASRPSFDPNLFATHISPGEWKQLAENPDFPLQNRTIQSSFSPGSIFKLVMAIAGLESGVIDDTSPVYCGGGVTLYGHRFRCWKAGGHGRVTLREAIRDSCNVYFYLLGQKLGITAISDFSHLVGFGLPTGVDLTGEVKGLVPSERWKQERTGQPWYAGETISVAIGQGPLNVTPIQLARAIGIIATGQDPQLHLAGRPLEKPVASLESQFSQMNLQVVREAMWSVVNEWGTGRGAQVAGFEVCGKTGTAQVIGRSRKEDLSEEEQNRFEANAWFAGFAPLHDPQIVVIVIVQRGGSGGSAAAPIAGRIFETYYQKYKKKSADGLEVASRQKDGTRM